VVFYFLASIISLFDNIFHFSELHTSEPKFIAAYDKPEVFTDLPTLSSSPFLFVQQSRHHLTYKHTDTVHSPEDSVMAESRPQGLSAGVQSLIEQHQALKRRIDNDTAWTDAKINDTFLSQIVGGLGLLTKGEVDSKTMGQEETEGPEAEDQDMDESGDDDDEDQDYDPTTELPDAEEMYSARETTLSAEFEDTAVRWLSEIRPQIVSFSQHPIISLENV
jgi:hypothetical protein